jgi:hypothetical protein
VLSRLLSRLPGQPPDWLQGRLSNQHDTPARPRGSSAEVEAGPAGGLPFGFTMILDLRFYVRTLSLTLYPFFETAKHARGARDSRGLRTL